MIDKLLSLPKLDASTLSGVQSRVEEAVQKVASTGAGIITSIASGAPSFTQLASASVLGNPVGPILSGISNSLGSALNSASGLLSSAFPTSTGLNNLIPGLPTSMSASALREEVGEPMDASSDVSHKVRLVSQIDGSEVVFENMPEVNEVRAIEYEALAPPHMPGEFQKYRGTKSTQWTINVVLTASTVNDATINRYYVNTLRAWSMPYFGEAQTYAGRLGAPPPILDFSGWRGLVGTVPVAITSMNWTWPKDVDWLPTLDIDQQSGMKIPFPSVITLNITLVEALSAVQFNAFDLASFRAGDMIGAYSSQQANTIDNSSEPSFGAAGQSLSSEAILESVSPLLPQIPSGLSSIPLTAVPTFSITPN